MKNIGYFPGAPHPHCEAQRGTSGSSSRRVRSPLLFLPWKALENVYEVVSGDTDHGLGLQAHMVYPTRGRNLTSTFPCQVKIRVTIDALMLGNTSYSTRFPGLGHQAEYQVLSHRRGYTK